MGRPSLLTPERRDRIIQLARYDVPQEIIAAAAGVGTSTLYSWLQQGRAERHRIDEGLDPDPGAHQYLELLEDYERARGDGAAELHLQIVRAGKEPKNWRANLELLERRWRDHYQKTDRLEVAYDESAIAQRVAEALSAILVTLELDPEQRAAVRTQLAEALRHEHG